MRRDDYRVLAETERFGAAISACDLVLARSGSTVWEFAAAGKPAILVPYPFATGDHQALNAQHFVEAGGAIMVRELDLDDVPELVPDHVPVLLGIQQVDQAGEHLGVGQPAGAGRRGQLLEPGLERGDEGVEQGLAGRIVQLHLEIARENAAGEIAVGTLLRAKRV